MSQADTNCRCQRTSVKVNADLFVAWESGRGVAPRDGADSQAASPLSTEVPLVRGERWVTQPTRPMPGPRGFTLLVESGVGTLPKVGLELHPIPGAEFGPSPRRGVRPDVRELRSTCLYWRSPDGTRIPFPLV